MSDHNVSRSSFGECSFGDTWYPDPFSFGMCSIGIISPSRAFLNL